jgi:predicted porin
MQKKIIALAIAGLMSGAAFAASNVTIYGIMDQGIGYARGASPDGIDKSYSNMGLVNGGWSGSRLGFRGTEDLGNGLRAIWTLEMNMIPNEGRQTASTTGGEVLRQAFVGLDTNAGQFTLGRQYAPSFSIIAGNTAFGAASGNTGLLAFIGPAGFLHLPANIPGNLTATPTFGTTMTTGNNSRWNNSIAWQSKNMGGVTLRAIYAFGMTGHIVSGNPESKIRDNGRMGVSGSYRAGPFNIDAVYQTVRRITAAPAAPGDTYNVNDWYIGGGYDFGVAKVVGSYQNYSNKLSGNDTGLKAGTYALGAIVPVSAPGKLRFEVAQMRAKFNEVAAGDSNKTGRATAYSIGYTHDLSRRTMLYATLGHVRNKQNDDGFPDIAAGGRNMGTAYAVGAPGKSNSSFLAGIRHTF